MASEETAAPCESPLRPAVSSLSPDVVGVVEEHHERGRERRARPNGSSTREKLQAHVASLERTALVLRVIHDDDTIWDEFLDDDTKRIRAYHRQFAAVVNDLKQLACEKAQLQRLLTERELARRAVARIKETMEQADEWRVRCAMWKTLARTHYRPLTSCETTKLIDAAHLEMTDHLKRTDKQTSGLTFMGWRDMRCLVPEKMAVEYSLHKRSCASLSLRDRYLSVRETRTRSLISRYQHTLCGRRRVDQTSLGLRITIIQLAVNFTWAVHSCSGLNHFSLLSWAWTAS